MAFLVLDRLTKQFGEQTAVDGLSLTVEPGEFISLLGPSGCGKTTTLQMIAGFVEATSGAVMLEGRDLLKVKPAQRGLGIVFQSYALFPHMTAAQNVAFGLEMQRVAAAEREARVRDTLKLVGLSALADRYPRKMSGGQQQRVALARALVIRPRILLLDEPLSNLDAKLREEMQIELRQIQRTVGTTTLLVTHDQSEAMSLSDRIVVMNAGRVEQIARPHEAYENPATPFVASFLGKTNVLAATSRREGGESFALIGDGRWPVANLAGDRLRVTVRPEKIGFVDAAACSIGGRVATRIFQGNHWLYQVDTPCGLVTVIRQNSGERVPDEGSAVRLTWRPEDMAVRPEAP
jgi:putative spermidine/putrescine transport system ATP-binding protein